MALQVDGRKCREVIEPFDIAGNGVYGFASGYAVNDSYILLDTMRFTALAASSLYVNLGNITSNMEKLRNPREASLLNMKGPTPTLHPSQQG